jgi:hypothetical protein
MERAPLATARKVIEGIEATQMIRKDQVHSPIARDMPRFPLLEKGQEKANGSCRRERSEYHHEICFIFAARAAHTGLICAMVTSRLALRWRNWRPIDCSPLSFAASARYSFMRVTAT